MSAVIIVRSVVEYRVQGDRGMLKQSTWSLLSQAIDKEHPVRLNTIATTSTNKPPSSSSNHFSPFPENKNPIFSSNVAFRCFPRFDFCLHSEQHSGRSEQGCRTCRCPRRQHFRSFVFTAIGASGGRIMGYQGSDL